MQSHHQLGGCVDGTHVHDNARSWKAWAHRIGHALHLANECKYLKQQPTYIHLASGSPAGLNYGETSDWGAVAATGVQGVNDALSRCVLMTNPPPHTYIRTLRCAHACICMQDDELSMLSHRAQVLY